MSGARHVSSSSKMSSISFSQLKHLATDVYTKIGPWASESIYQNAMKYALIKAGFAVESERDIPVEYDGMYVGTVRADLVVAKQLVIELKAVTGATTSTVETATMQCRHYLQLTGISVGAVVVFPQRDGQEVFCKEVTLADPESEVEESDAPAPVPAIAAAPFDNLASGASKKTRKPRAPMTSEAKAQMMAKRAATIAAKTVKV